MAKGYGLVVFLMFLSLSCTATQLENEDYDAIRREGFSIAKDLCLDDCLQKLKSDEGCSIFCRFMTHIREDHAIQFEDLWFSTGQSMTVLEYAMSDAVDWRLRTRIEDEENVAKQFLDRYEFWAKYSQAHMEL